MHSDSFGLEMDRLSTLIDRLEGKVCVLRNVVFINQGVPTFTKIVF